MIGDSNKKTNFLHRLSLTDWQVSRLYKAFAINSSANIKLSKIILSNIAKSGGFLGRLAAPLMTVVNR